MTTERTFEEILAEIARTSTPTVETVKTMAEAVTGMFDTIVAALVEYDLDSYELLKELIESKFNGLSYFTEMEIIFAEEDDGSNRKVHIYNRNVGKQPNTFGVFVYATGSGLFIMLEKSKKQ